MSTAEARRIGLGMLSTQMQRVEANVTGRAKGPPPISADPELFHVVAPQPTPAERRRRPGQEAYERPSHTRSGSDLLWRAPMDSPSPRKPPAPRRSEFARFFPATNRGRPTSQATLAAMAERKAQDVFARSHAAKAPARLAVRLTKEVLDMCREYQVDPRALMRETANPLSGQVHVMHSPYTPSWDFSIGVFEPGLDAEEGFTPKSARSAPGSSRKGMPARTGAAGGGARAAQSLSARPRPPPKPVLDETEVEEVEREVGREIEELRKRRQEQMRRRTRVALEEQRRHQQSVENEVEQERWRMEQRRREVEKQRRAALAAKRHVAEAAEARMQHRARIEVDREDEAMALSLRWAEQEAADVKERQEHKKWVQERADLEMKEHTARVKANAQRAAARALAVDEYNRERAEAEEEASQRARTTLEEKRQAAETRMQGYEQRRQEASTKKAELIEKRDKEVQLRFDQRREHDEIIEQQQRERMMIPYRQHEKDRQREAEAPREAKRMQLQRERELRLQYADEEEVVSQNRADLEQGHREWVQTQREKRSEVVQRIDDVAKARQARTEEHARKVKEFDQAVAKREAKRDLRARALRAEREAFRQTQASAMDAVYKSSVAKEVISDGVLDAIIGGGNKQKSPRRVSMRG